MWLLFDNKNMNLGLGLIALGLGNQIITQGLREEFECTDT